MSLNSIPSAVLNRKEIENLAVLLENASIIKLSTSPLFFVKSYGAKTNNKQQTTNNQIAVPLTETGGMWWAVPHPTNLRVHWHQQQLPTVPE